MVVIGYLAGTRRKMQRTYRVQDRANLYLRDQERLETAAV